MRLEDSNWANIDIVRHNSSATGPITQLSMTVNQPSDLALHLILLIDVSGSMNQPCQGNGDSRLQVVKDSIQQLLNSLPQEPYTISLITFNDHATTVLEKHRVVDNASRTTFDAKLGSIEATDTTSFEAAARSVRKELLDDNARNCLLFFTDGHDTTAPSETPPNVLANQFSRLLPKPDTPSKQALTVVPIGIGTEYHQHFMHQVATRHGWPNVIHTTGDARSTEDAMALCLNFLHPSTNIELTVRQGETSWRFDYFPLGVTQRFFVTDSAPITIQWGERQKAVTLTGDATCQPAVYANWVWRRMAELFNHPSPEGLLPAFKELSEQVSSAVQKDEQLGHNSAVLQALDKLQAQISALRNNHSNQVRQMASSAGFSSQGYYSSQRLGDSSAGFTASSGGDGDSDDAQEQDTASLSQSRYRLLNSRHKRSRRVADSAADVFCSQDFSFGPPPGLA